jgi:chromosome segregation ATPase
MRKIWAIIFAEIFCSATPPLWPQTTQPSFSDSIVNLNGSQWKSVIAQFEESVYSLSKWLEDYQAEMKNLQGDIRDLEGKIARLREQTQNGSGVLDEIRLKGLLNDLKEKLEKNSDLQHQWDERQKEFEQKAMSLIALYNSRIDTDLEGADLSSQNPQLNLTMNELVLLIQKRNQTLTLLKRYQKKSETENSLPLTSFGALRFDDREGLLLTLDLIRDRKKSLEEQLEKWSIEEDEVKNELKLQGKMKEFMDDIERMNEDSSFPHSSLKRSDLGDVAGDKERKKLQARLDDLQQMIVHGQTSLSQLEQLMEKVQSHLSVLDKREEK